MPTPPPKHSPARRAASVGAAAIVCCLLVSACGSDRDESPPPQMPTGPAPVGPMAAGNVEALRHDFGTLRHGQVEHHTFVVPLPDDQRAYVPLGYARNCVCASHEFVIVGADDHERFPTGQPLPQYAVQPGERLELRLRLDTGEKEAADLPPTVIPGEIVLRDLGLAPNELRVPVRFQFAILTPIAVSPAAAIDFGRMPRSIGFTRTYVLESREGPTKFGPVRCLERAPHDPSTEVEVADVTVELRQGPADRRAELTLTFRPAPDRALGPLGFQVEIETDLPSSASGKESGDSDLSGPPRDHYVLRLPASAFVIPDIELGPPGKIAFGQIDIASPTRAQLVITDHDTSRSPEFFVVGVVDELGADASKHFVATVESVPEQPRSRAIILGYDGGLAELSYFRGHVHLSKTEAGAVDQKIEFSGFRRR